MSSPVAVEVVGLSKVLRQMKQIDPDLVAQIKAANRDIADDVVTTARTLSPKETGTLAGSLRPGATNRTGIVRAGSRKVPWAGPIHFGWRARNIKPNPFLYDAFDERRDDVEDRYLAAMLKIAGSLD
jgi:hypothetical protein|tara:strand:+ start:761 stop:1141 length:381 start_codon:yes stop_codon:yes gene_type:complete